MADWISVREECPKVNGMDKVAVLIEGRFVDTGYYGIANENEGVCFFSWDEFGFCTHEHVTHWQPLPEPPK